MGRFGQELIPDRARVLTHCNAGALATAGYGTALGVIRAAVEAGKQIEVYADETRPFLQGARLTAWELQKDSIPVTVITDNMAAFMQKGKIDCIIVAPTALRPTGCGEQDRHIFLSGSCERKRRSFFRCGPDFHAGFIDTGRSHIPIEERDPDEVRKIMGVSITPIDVQVANPAFDVTPNRYVHAIIRQGNRPAPYHESLQKLARGDA